MINYRHSKPKMTEQDKQQLLQDLCSRLPYGVKVYNTSFAEPYQVQTLFGRKSEDEFIMKETYKSFDLNNRPTRIKNYTGYLDRLKPYLRPMSSMTKEEKLEYISIIDGTRWTTTVGLEEKIILSIDLVECKAEDGTPDNIYDIIQMTPIDWLLERHFDIRGLIYKDLAIKVTEENNPYKI